MAENPLQRAHALSAQASVLLKPTTAPLASLQDAHGKITEATDLFESAASQPRGEDERRTLQMLVNQHKKLARDVERRISISKVKSPASGSSGSSPVAESTGTSSGGGARPPSPRLSPRRDAVGLATATAPWPAGISTRIGMPPFAIRPPNLSTPQPPINRSTTSPPVLSPRSSTTHPETRSLYSSSSSDESFLHLGMVPDSMDPFSRFWGMLDNMLVDISNPVAFASAPIGPISPASPGSEATHPKQPSSSSSVSGSSRANTSSSTDRRRPDGVGVIHERDTQVQVTRSSSPTDSFYVVPKLQSRTDTSTRGTGISTSATGPNSKTPEELALENENLRLSLDAIASHAQSLERANKALREQFEERERMMRSVAVGMRREAHKVKQGQDLMRSQLLASVNVNTPRATSDPAPRPDGSVEQSRARIRQLEQEITQLKTDNEKQKLQIEKYKDKFAQLKASAKAKREARSTAGGSSKSGSTIREDVPED